MKKTFNQNFIIRQVSKNGGTTSLVYLRITVNGRRTELSLQRECETEKWDSSRGRLIGKTEDVRSFNIYLDSVHGKIYEIFQSFISSGMDFDASKIKARYLGLDNKQPKMFLEVYEGHNKEFELLVGRGLSYRSLQKYRTIKGYAAEFISSQYRLSDIELDKVDYEFIRGFEIWIKTGKGCCHNTTINYLKRIKKIINQCLAKRWIYVNPFAGYKMSVNETHKTFLSEHELLIVAGVELSNSSLEQVRDLFLFSCYTGLAYCDVIRLTPTNVVVGVDGEKWISINRQRRMLLRRSRCFLLLVCYSVSM